MEFLLTGKEPSVITNDTGNTIIEGDQSQEVIRYDRKNPVRAEKLIECGSIECMDLITRSC